MKSIVYLTILAVVVFAACKKKEETPTPSACFMVDETASTDPAHNFAFTNCSKNFSSASWDFGDGHSSDDFNPSHRFNSIGEYTVTLTALNSNGLTSTNTRSITIGHYTLTKIIYNKLNAAIPYPKDVTFSCYSSSLVPRYNHVAGVNSPSQLPVMAELPDDPIYDNYSSFFYRFSENDLATHFYSTSYFDISDLDIVNGRVDYTFLYLNDTAKVSLYFKIVPR